MTHYVLGTERGENTLSLTSKIRGEFMMQFFQFFFSTGNTRHLSDVNTQNDFY